MALDEASLPVITDEKMRENLGKSRIYRMVFLRKGPGYGTEAAKPLIWEHGRRNMRLREAGIMPLVGPLAAGDTTGVVGISVFHASGEEVRAIMDADPAVKAGIFYYDVYDWRSFPGATLPE